MVLAQGLTDQSSTAKHTLGQRYVDPATGNEYIYVQDSGSANAQYMACSINSAFKTTLLTTTLANAGYPIGVPQIAVTASYYFWCLIKGTGTVHTASACASEAQLYTTSVAGRIDDARAGTLAPINGIILTATAATAAASANTAGLLDHPKVDLDATTWSRLTSLNG
jgi:hypothetical protein